MIGFLDSIGYIGFANFDMKYDDRDGRYKLFEMNPRQGRSSYFSTAAGGNLAQVLAEDVIFGREVPLTVADREVLWTILPNRVLFRYGDGRDPAGATGPPPDPGEKGLPFPGLSARPKREAAVVFL